MAANRSDRRGIDFRKGKQCSRRIAKAQSDFRMQIRHIVAGAQAGIGSRHDQASPEVFGIVLLERLQNVEARIRKSYKRRIDAVHARAGHEADIQVTHRRCRIYWFSFCAIVAS